MLEKQVATIVAEVCIMICGIAALANGLDGAIFASCITAIAGLGGYSVWLNRKL